MWHLKLKVQAKNLFLGKLAYMYGVGLLGYPLSYHKDKKHLYVTLVGFISGDKHQIAKVIAGAKKSPQLLSLENNNEFIIAKIKQPLFYEPIFDPLLIRPVPSIIDKDGVELWEVAAWKRSDLNSIIALAKNELDGEIVSIQQKQTTSVSMANLNPQMTPKQKQALKIAIDYGYYVYPKKIDLHELAKISRLSYSTYQEHLKKAEAKIMGSYRL